MRRRCASRSECSATTTPARIVNRPKPPHAATSGVISLHRGARARALRRGEPIDDAAEQQRFGELREGDRDVGDDQRPGQTPLRRQLAEHAGVEFQETHTAAFTGSEPAYEPRGMISRREAAPRTARPDARTALDHSSKMGGKTAASLLKPLISLNREDENPQAFTSLAKDILGDFECFQCFAEAPWSVPFANDNPRSRASHRFLAFKQPQKVYRQSSEKAKTLQMSAWRERADCVARGL